MAPVTIIRIRALLIAVALLPLLPACTAQTQPNPDSKLPEFDVATIKPTNPSGMHNVGVDVFPGGRVIINGASLKTLICVAFNISYWQLSGGEPWLAQATFNLEAKPPEGAKPPITNLVHSYWTIDDPRIRQMLQALLRDRFQLKYHYETKTGPIYLLQKSGKRIALKPCKAESNQISEPDPGREGQVLSIPLPQQTEIDFTDNRWMLFNTTMPQLAQFASNSILHRPVLDETNLDGAFDYKSPTQIDIAPEPNGHTIDLSGAFPLLLREIGLKLTPSKGPIDSLIIDSSQQPTAN